jgi:hypothetical protein
VQVHDRTGWGCPLALREKRPHDAQKFLIELARDYPQNRLFRAELAKLNNRIGISAN